MNLPGKRIVTFIRKHHILTLATVHDQIPWCCTLFYVYLPEQNLFVVTSDPDTRHITDVVAGGSGRVAGAIALETKIIGRIRGIQFTATMFPLQDELLQICKTAYLKRFPVARFTTLHLWGIEPDLIKMTDNRLGFGKKLYWRKEDT
jgi:uncharacterized protein YhbP (UPF0306 family)